MSESYAHFRSALSSPQPTITQHRGEDLASGDSRPVVVTKLFRERPRTAYSANIGVPAAKIG